MGQPTRSTQASILPWITWITEVEKRRTGPLGLYVLQANIIPVIAGLAAA